MVTMLPCVEKLVHALRRNVGDLRLGVKAVGDDAGLRPGQGHRRRSEPVQRHRQQRDGSLFARGQQHVHFAFVRLRMHFFASLISESVTPLMAETTATTLLPARWWSPTRRATFLIRSGLPTEVPPYF